MQKAALFLLVLAAIGCSTKPKETPVMTGAYTMLSQTLTSPTATDSALAASQQLKIYTPDFTMYARVGTADSSASFGIASYTTEPGGLTENVIFSAADTSRNTTGSFKLEIEKTPAGFKQLISGMDSGRYDLKEEYESVGSAATTALDGAWKLTKYYYVSGKDTTTFEGEQYRVYHAGYIMFGGSYLDSAKVRHTVVGYGKFEMPDANKVKETAYASNIYQVRGRSFDIKIELMGGDAFRQFIEGPNGVQIEEYQRLKK